MVKLRVLQEEDAEFMLEWMKDPDIQKCYQKRMSHLTLEDAKQFCKMAFHEDCLQEASNLHYAIVDERDEYLGTISLKNISMKSMTAEYAISTRRVAQGKGIAKKATRLLLKKGFQEFGLHKIYLNVLSDNEHAIKFYEKCGFKYEGEFREHIYLNGEYKSLRWYGMFDSEFDESRFAAY